MEGVGKADACLAEVGTHQAGPFPVVGTACLGVQEGSQAEANDRVSCTQKSEASMAEYEATLTEASCPARGTAEQQKAGQKEEAHLEASSAGHRVVT